MHVCMHACMAACMYTVLREHVPGFRMIDNGAKRCIRFRRVPSKDIIG